MAVQDGGIEGHMLIFSCKNSKITTCCWTGINRKMLDPPKKDIPHPRAKEKPQQDSRRGEFTFRIKPHTRQRHSKGSIKPWAHQDPEFPQRLSQNCVWVSPAEVWVRSRLLQGQGLWVQKQTLEWHKQKLVHTRTQEKGAETPQETEPDLHESVQKAPAELWVGSGLLQGWRHWVQQCMNGTFWRRSTLSSLLPP